MINKDELKILSDLLEKLRIKGKIDIGDLPAEILSKIGNDTEKLDEELIKYGRYFSKYKIGELLVFDNLPSEIIKSDNTYILDFNAINEKISNSIHKKFLEVKQLESSIANNRWNFDKRWYFLLIPFFILILTLLSSMSDLFFNKKPNSKKQELEYLQPIDNNSDSSLSILQVGQDTILKIELDISTD